MSFVLWTSGTDVGCSWTRGVFLCVWLVGASFICTIEIPTIASWEHVWKLNHCFNYTAEWRCGASIWKPNRGERRRDGSSRRFQLCYFTRWEPLTQKLLIFRACQLLLCVALIVLVLLFYCTSGSKQNTKLFYVNRYWRKAKEVFQGLIGECFFVMSCAQSKEVQHIWLGDSLVCHLPLCCVSSELVAGRVCALYITHDQNMIHNSRVQEPLSLEVLPKEMANAEYG